MVGANGILVFKTWGKKRKRRVRKNQEVEVELEDETTVIQPIVNQLLVKIPIINRIDEFGFKSIRVFKDVIDAYSPTLILVNAISD